MSEAQPTAIAHSTTPWKVGHESDWHGKKRTIIVSDYVDKLGIHYEILGAICEVSDPDDAEFICRAVNAHEALVKTLQAFIDRRESLVASGEAYACEAAMSFNSEISAALAALALAKGEK